jgi:transposase
MQRYHTLRDDQWEQIKNLLPGRAGTVGVTAKNNRLFLNAVLYRYRVGMPWRDLPSYFGNWSVVHTRFSRWAKKGVLLKVFMHLAADADNEYAMIDSSIVRAHQHSSVAEKDREAQAIGRSKGGLSTKIHTVVDALGNPIKFALTPGQACDLDGSDILLPGLEAKTILADKAYDADGRVIEPLLAEGKEIVIPSKKNRTEPRTIDKELYKARHLIENFFCKLKQFRAIATRYEKTARNFLAAIHLAAVTIWLN